MFNGNCIWRWNIGLHINIGRLVDYPTASVRRRNKKFFLNGDEHYNNSGSENLEKGRILRKSALVDPDPGTASLAPEWPIGTELEMNLGLKLICKARPKGYFSDNHCSVQASFRNAAEPVISPLN